MDDIDRRLIGLLRENARLPVASLAKTLGVSRGTVQNRIDRLISQGILQGFTVKAKPEAEGMRAVMLLSIEGERFDHICQVLRGFPEVRAVHSTNGRWDIIVELSTATLADFDRVLHRIRLIAGVAASETSLLLASYYF